MRCNLAPLNEPSFKTTFFQSYSLPRANFITHTYFFFPYQHEVSSPSVIYLEVALLLPKCCWQGNLLRGIVNSYCSYLDIYISRKIRLCVVDFEGKFQTNLQAKLINFLVWKFRSTYYANSYLIFFRICQIHCFFTYCCCYSKELTDLNCDFCMKLQFKYVNFLEQQQQCVKSSGFDKFCKKQKKNEYNRFEFPDQKVDWFGRKVGLKFAYKINYTQPDFS